LSNQYQPPGCGGSLTTAIWAMIAGWSAAGIGTLNSSSIGMATPTVSPLPRYSTVLSRRLALVMVWKAEVATVSAPAALTAVAVTV